MRYAYAAQQLAALLQLHHTRVIVSAAIALLAPAGVPHARAQPLTVDDAAPYAQDLFRTLSYGCQMQLL